MKNNGLFALLQPFAIATHMLESGSIPAAYTIPIIAQAITKFRENATIVNANHEMVNKIIESV